MPKKLTYKVEEEMYIRISSNGLEEGERVLITIEKF